MSKLWDAITALQQGQAAMTAQLAAHGEVVGDMASKADLDALGKQVSDLTANVADEMSAFDKRVSDVENGPANSGDDAGTEPTSSGTLSPAPGVDPVNDAGTTGTTITDTTTGAAVPI